MRSEHENATSQMNYIFKKHVCKYRASDLNKLDLNILQKYLFKQ